MNNTLLILCFQRKSWFLSDLSKWHILPLKVIMKGDKEIVGTLRGFDDYVNMVMDAMSWVS